MLDIAIVGGGPAGSMAARALARGHEVAVLEEHPESGIPMQCAGLLTERAVSLAGVSPEVFSTYSHARVVFPDGGSITVGDGHTIAMAVDRTDLDRKLADAAMDAGAEYRYSTRYRSHTVSDRVTVSTDYYELESRMIVGADGHSSKVAMSLGDNGPKEYIRGIEADVARRYDDQDTFVIRLGSRYAPGFFTWELPCGDFTRIGLCCSWDRGLPAEYLKRLLDDAAPGARILQKYSGKIPIGGRRAMSGERCILTGDAAGLVKPISGGGIYPTAVTIPALTETVSAALAADDLSAKRLSSYDRSCRKLVGREMKHGYALRRRFVAMDDDALSDCGRLASDDRIRSKLDAIDLDSPSSVVRAMVSDPRCYGTLLRIARRSR